MYNITMDMQIIAHRGSSGERVENTIEAFVKARDDGADFIEFDVQQTADDYLVIYHDSHFKDGINVSDISYEEFRRRTKYLGVDAPLFDDVLYVLNGEVGINIEIKCLKDVELLNRQTKHYPNDKIIFSSFDHTVIAQLKKNNPTVNTATLLVSRLLDPIPVINSLESEILCQHYEFVDKGYVELIHSYGKKIYVWTLNYIPDIHWFIELGVDGIFTDYPARVKKILSQY